MIPFAYTGKDPVQGKITQGAASVWFLLEVDIKQGNSSVVQIHLPHLAVPGQSRLQCRELRKKVAFLPQKTKQDSVLGFLLQSLAEILKVAFVSWRFFVPESIQWVNSSVCSLSKISKWRRARNPFCCPVIWWHKALRFIYDLEDESKLCFPVSLICMKRYNSCRKIEVLLLHSDSSSSALL